MNFLSRKIKKFHTILHILVIKKYGVFFLLDSSLLSVCPLISSALSKIFPFKHLNMGCYHLCEPWTLARYAVPIQHLLFGLSTTSSPASAIFNVPIQWRNKSFQPRNLKQAASLYAGGEMWWWPSSFMRRKKWRWCHQQEVEEQAQPSLPFLSCFTSWDTWHEKWAPDLTSALKFTCVSGSVESTIYFSCRPKRWVCLSVPK